MLGHFFHDMAEGKRQGGQRLLKMQDKQKRVETMQKNPGRSGSCRSHEKTLKHAILDLHGPTSARQAPTAATSWRAREAPQDGDHLSNLHRPTGPQARVGEYRFERLPLEYRLGACGAQGTLRSTPE
ncbi:hypothetical protein Celaphus_00003857, partial [Cervus elaphus hippelaphus]